jgi:nucleoside-diphosphate-sugar epimerase
MKLFITGASGFIGSHLMNQAFISGHTVVAPIRNPRRKSRIPLLQEPVWIEKPMEALTPSDMEGCDVLIHLAAHTPNTPYDNLANCLHYNLTIPLQVFENAKKAGINHYIVAGTCFEYGRSGERYNFIPVDAPLEPTSSYAASKAASSIAFKQWAIEHNQSLAICRIFHVFGEGELNKRLWPSLRFSAHNGDNLPMTLGEQVRDFISAEAVAKEFLWQAKNLQRNTQSIDTMNIGSGKPQTILQFCEHWWSKWGAKGVLLPGALPYRTGEVMRYVPVISQSKSGLS